MAKTVTLYHNPRCSKSRQTLAVLRDHGVEPTIVEYLKNPLSARAVSTLIGKLGIEPHDLLRRREAPYRELGLSADSTKADVAAAIAAHPILMERPVVVVGDRARIGRPPEAVLRIL